MLNFSMWSSSVWLREHVALPEKTTNQIAGLDEMLSQEDINIALIDKVNKSDVNAYKVLMDSAYGAVKQIK